MNNKAFCKLVKVEPRDCDLLFEWANEPAVRENSFNSKEIEYVEHVKWFNEQLELSSSILLILKVNEDRVGLIRLSNLQEDQLLINYSIAKEFRGFGYATFLLKLIKAKYSDFILVGKVKSSNIASIKAFNKAGYKMKDECNSVKVFYSK